MPVTFEVTFQVPKLNPLAQFLILGDMVRVSREWALEVRAKARIYPPKRPGQTYVRTYRLKNDWRVEGPRLVAGDLITDIVNNTPYAAKVHGNNRGSGQAQIHRSRWPKVLEIGTGVLPLGVRAQAALNSRANQLFVQETIRIA